MTSPPSLWQRLPRDWRVPERDPDGLLADLVAVLDAELAEQHAELAAFRDVWAPFRAQARFLPYQAASLGWALDTSAPVALQRKVVSLLVPLYRQKGTQRGMVNILRLFLGVEARVRAPWADGWRLSRSALGGPRHAFTASGGETLVDASSLRWTRGHRALSVWRNGVPLARTEYQESDAGTLVLLTRGARFVVTAWETMLTLPWSYTPGSGSLHVEKNGVELTPDLFTEYDATHVALSYLPALGDEILVRTTELPTPLTAGDVIVVRSAERGSTRLGPDPSTDPGEALRLVVEVPRALTSAERALALRLLEVWRPSKATLTLLEPPTTTPRPPWRLGRSFLGRDARVAPR